MDPYDLYDMDEEEMEEMKKDALAWLHEQGYTRVVRHGRCVCPYYNLANRQWGFVTSYSMLLALVVSRGRHRALEEYSARILVMLHSIMH
jgi:ribosome modulation factor